VVHRSLKIDIIIPTSKTAEVFDKNRLVVTTPSMSKNSVPRYCHFLFRYEWIQHAVLAVCFPKQQFYSVMIPEASRLDKMTQEETVITYVNDMALILAQKQQ